MTDLSAAAATTSTPPPAAPPAPAQERGAPPGPASSPPPRKPPSGLRRWLQSTPGRAVSSLLIVVVLGSIAAYSGDLWGLRLRLQPLPKPAEPVAHGGSSRQPGQPVLASTPYWQAVTTLQGDASGATQTVDIAQGALQWRVAYSCQPGGRLSVRAGGSALVDQGCPTSGTQYGTQTGSIPLTVQAGGPWQVRIEEQIDTPRNDAPLPAMTGATAVETGTFYNVDFDGRGTATVYRLADGSYALRLESFYVTPNSSLDVRFSTSAAPHSDDDVANSTVAPVAGLDATAGSMNFTVPPGIDPSRFGSLVVWCISLRTAYAAATLHAAGR